jgi:hypothetical protein
MLSDPDDVEAFPVLDAEDILSGARQVDASTGRSPEAPEAMTATPEADAWDAGERHPSERMAAGARWCRSHEGCNPYTDPELRAAFDAGCLSEDRYVNMWGQFNPHGHLDNPFRYPPKPLVSDEDVQAILARHLDGAGTRTIARELNIKRPLVMGVIRKAGSDA